jgi:hypothetical protein
MHNRVQNKFNSEKNQFDKEKRGWDGKQEKQFLTAMAWKRGELDMGRPEADLGLSLKPTKST